MDGGRALEGAEVRETGQDRIELWRGLLIYAGFFVILITWSPFRLRWPSPEDVVLYSTLRDILVNLFLFVPLGFLFAASLRAEIPWVRSLKALGFGCAFSVVIEIGQLFVDGRFPSPFDVVTNGIGAWMGAEVYRWIALDLIRRLGHRLALELPLSNAFYLLSALVFMSSTARSFLHSGELLTLLPAASATVILASLWRHRLHQGIRGRWMVPIAAGWFTLVTAPLLDPRITVAGSATVALVTWLLIRRGPVGPERGERRFEGPTLRWIAPVFLAYLVLLALWPLPRGLGGWDLRLALSGFSQEPTISEILHLLEVVCAFTAGGYMLAESRGRRVESGAAVLIRAAVIAAAVAVVLEVLRGAHPVHHASPLQVLLSVCGAVIGAAIYRVHLAAVRAWLAAPDPPEGAGRIDGDPRYS